MAENDGSYMSIQDDGNVTTDDIYGGRTISPIVSPWIDRYTVREDLNTDDRRLIDRNSEDGNVHMKASFLSSLLLHKVKFADFYHYLVDLTWWKLFGLVSISYLFIQLFFGLLYFLDRKGLSPNHKNYLDCFFFSTQTFSTVGFGGITPESIYANMLVYFQCWFSLFFEAATVALIFAKMSRPSRMKRNIVFSNHCLFHEPINAEGKTEYFITFRMLNLRIKSSIINSRFQLLCVIHDPKLPEQMSFHELDFKMHEQMSSASQIELSTPILPFPWLVTHHITEDSPLYPYLVDTSKRDPVTSFELIPVLSGQDAATGDSYQTRFSYKRSEMLIGMEFEPCVKWVKNNYLILFHNFNRTRPI